MRDLASSVCLVLLALSVGGCHQRTSQSARAPEVTTADIKANLARLEPGDLRIAEHQKYCPMMDGVQLGEMGPPCKITVKGVSAFVCCENCARKAQEDPDWALEQIRKLRQDQIRS